MARGVNKAIILGNVGKEPDVRYTQDGKAIVSLSIATSEQWKDKNSGEKQERTEWHRVVFFGKVAEIAAEYVKKGSKIYVEGKLATRKWTDQQGQDRYTTEIIADQLQLLDSRQDGGGQQGQQRQQRQDQQQAPAGGDSFDQFDDDIPF